MKNSLKTYFKTPDLKVNTDYVFKDKGYELPHHYFLGHFVLPVIFMFWLFFICHIYAEFLKFNFEFK